MTDRFDLIILGGGKRIVLVEQRDFGGPCRSPAPS